MTIRIIKYAKTKAILVVVKQSSSVALKQCNRHRGYIHYLKPTSINNQPKNIQNE